MTAFFIRTEQTAVGPFTGIELREAALAGILLADSVIGGSPNGPWFYAVDTGLFSEKKMPLPHPEGTHVPRYHVQGLRVAASGPFKLRELIGFAARGMLHADAQLQSDLAPDWFTIERIPVLKACLEGHLVLLGADGKVVRRAHAESNNFAAPKARAPREAEPASVAAGVVADSQVGDQSEYDAVVGDAEAVAPVHAAGNDTASRFVSSGSFEETPLDDEEANESTRVTSVEEFDVDAGAPRWWRRRIELPSLNPTIHVSRRLVINSLLLVLLVGGIGTAFSQYNAMGVPLDQVLGDWIAEDGTFAVSFRDDGSCAVFNVNGHSWSGQYEWTERDDDDEGFTSLGSIDSQFDVADEAHQADAIRSTDGYMRLRSSAHEPSYIGNHAVSDLYLRPDGSTLHVGYLTSIRWSSSGREMQAGWVKLRRNPPIGVEAMMELATLPVEPPPKVGFTTLKAPHLTTVVQDLMDQYEMGENEEEVGTVCYSLTVDAKYLLQSFGVPDEARPLFPFEVQKLPNSEEFSGSQLARYGALKLILSPAGKVQYAELMP